MTQETSEGVIPEEAASTNGSTAGGPTFPVIDPATGREIARVHEDSPAEVAATVARVRSNQAEWEALGVAGRAKWLGQLRDWLVENAERVADSMQAETGKVRADASNESTRRNAA